MTCIHLTRDWLLWSLSVVYLFGFVSLFVQAPGLLGENGITPAKHLLEKEAESIEEFLSNRPTLLRLLPKIGLDVDVGIDFLCVAGVVVSFVAIISQDHRNALVAALQWIFYLSIAQVGQIFFSSKWDSLLLEVGFLAIFLAPLGLFGLHDRQVTSLPPVDLNENHRLPVWLLRWILFRLVLGEGLTGLVNIFGTNLHQETTAANLQNLLHLHEHQILPTPAAWLLNLLPPSLVAIATGFYVLSNVLGSVLILLPSKRIQKIVFYWQCITVVIGIFLSNQGFYPFLVLAISLALVDDGFFKHLQIFKRTSVLVNDTKAGTDFQNRGGPAQNGFSGVAKEGASPKGRAHLKSNLFPVVIGAFIVICALVCYGYPVLHSDSSESDIFLVGLLVSGMHSVYGSVGFIILVSLILGGTSLTFECVSVFKKQWCQKKASKAKKMLNMLRLSCLCVVVVSLFFVSWVPLTWFNDQESGQFLPSRLQQAYLWSHKHYKLVNNYVTISKRVEMNGTPVGRLELVLEGRRTQELEEWTEYSFRFKPGQLSSSLPVVAPHRPRLDESLWFASQSNYKQHHWVLNLVYRLLNNQAEVLELLGENPFPGEPPDYIKASIYEYHFAYNNNSNDKHSSSDWFTRKWIGHYLPTLSKLDPSFLRYLKLSGLISISDTKRSVPLQPCREINILGTFLGFIRSLLGQSNGSCLCIILVLLGLLLAFVDPSQRQSSISRYFPAYDFDGGHYRCSGKEEFNPRDNPMDNPSDNHALKSRHPLG